MLGPLGYEGWRNAHLGVEGQKGMQAAPVRMGGLYIMSGHPYISGSLAFSILPLFLEAILVEMVSFQLHLLKLCGQERLMRISQEPFYGPRERSVGVSDAPRTDSLGNECDSLPMVSNLEDSADC